uniref:Uncharacterized protein n=1 Tax=Anguilla anguilla TaxID=7936 RepID=A0A0E9WGL5_ANGAN
MTDIYIFDISQIQKCYVWKTTDVMRTALFLNTVGVIKMIVCVLHFFVT